MLVGKESIRSCKITSIDFKNDDMMKEHQKKKRKKKTSISYIKHNIPKKGTFKREIQVCISITTQRIHTRWIT